MKIPAIIAAATAVFAVGAGAAVLVTGDKGQAPSPAPAQVQGQVPAKSSDPDVIAVSEAARSGEYCKEVSSPDWTRADHKKETGARSNLMWALYDKGRAEAVNAAGVCSCAAYFPPFDTAEKQMLSAIGTMSPGEINDAARAMNASTSSSRKSAHKLCLGHKE